MTKLFVQTVIAFFAGALLLGLLLFLPAGTFNYWQAWVFIAVFMVTISVFGLYFRRVHRFRARPSLRVVSYAVDGFVGWRWSRGLFVHHVLLGVQSEQLWRFQYSGGGKTDGQLYRPQCDRSTPTVRRHHTTEVLESRVLMMRYARMGTKAAGEPLKFGIDSTPPSRKRLAEFLQACGLSLTEQRTLGKEAQGKRAWGGFTVATVK